MKEASRRRMSLSPPSWSHRRIGNESRRVGNLEFVVKGTRVSFQNSAPGGFNFFSMQGSIVARLTLASRTTSCTGSKTLTVQFKASEETMERKMVR